MSKEVVLQQMLNENSSREVSLRVHLIATDAALTQAWTTLKELVEKMEDSDKGDTLKANPAFEQWLVIREKQSEK